MTLRNELLEGSRIIVSLTHTHKHSVNMNIILSSRNIQDAYLTNDKRLIPADSAGYNLDPCLCYY